MSDDAPDQPPGAGEPSASRLDRLESWKAIAAYLDKDVSTVQRWEKSAALPVYRPSQGKVRNVYAFRSELHGWQNQHRALPDRGKRDDSDPLGGWQDPVSSVDGSVTRAPTGASSWRTRFRWSSLAVAILVVAATATSLIWLSRARQGDVLGPSVSPEVASGQGDFVLITQFENLTGDALFDGTLEYALEGELNNSPFVNVVPRARVNDVLRLMKKPVETKLDPGVAREVALRDGEIRAVVAGRVERLGSRYLLTASVLDLNGAAVASSTEEAVDDDEVPSAMRRLSNWLGAELGEALVSIEASTERLQKVTTPSLRALQWYSQGYDRYRQLQEVGLGAFGIYRDRLAERPKVFTGPAEFFRRAIAEDPEFASAYNMLGYTSARLDDPDAALRHWTRALELSPNTSERDRLFIEGTYYAKTGHPEQAAAKYKTLLALHPDHYYAVNNLVRFYSPGRSLDQTDEWLRWQVHDADQRPNNFGRQVRTARNLSRYEGQSDRWQRYAMRAYVLKPPTFDQWPWPNWSEFTWLNFFPAYLHWSRGEIDEAYREVERLTRSITTQSPEVRERYLRNVGTYYMVFGQLQKATDLFERHSNANYRAFGLAWIADCLDDAAATKEQLVQLSTGNGFRTWLNFSSGRLRVVRAGLPLERFGLSPDEANSQLALGELAFRRGDLVEAVERFERGLEGLGESFHSLAFFVASESLASAWHGLGNEPRALRVLEEAAHRTLRM